MGNWFYTLINDGIQHSENCEAQTFIELTARSIKSDLVRRAGIQGLLQDNGFSQDSPLLYLMQRTSSCPSKYSNLLISLPGPLSPMISTLLNLCSLGCPPARDMTTPSHFFLFTKEWHPNRWSLPCMTQHQVATSEAALTNRIGEGQ